MNAQSTTGMGYIHVHVGGCGLGKATYYVWADLIEHPVGHHVAETEGAKVEMVSK